MGEHPARAEMGGELRLGGEAGHHAHFDVGEQGAHCGHAGDAERTGAVDEHSAAGGGWVVQDGVHRHREGVGQHGQGVRHGGGDGDEHRVVGGEEVGPCSGSVGGHPDVHTGPERTTGEAPTQIQVPGLTRGAQWVYPARCAREPRIEDHPVTDLHSLCGGTELHDLSHHLVAGNVGKRGKGGHGVVDVAFAEVSQDEFGVGPADAREDRPGHHPVGTGWPGVVDDVQPERQRRQHALQVVGGLGSHLVGSGCGAEDECPHGRPP